MTNDHVTAGCGSMALLAENGWLPLLVLGTNPNRNVAVPQPYGFYDLASTAGWVTSKWNAVGHRLFSFVSVN